MNEDVPWGGDAIVPQVAANFIEAFIETEQS